MNALNVPLKLDHLDDEKVVFSGTDTTEVTRHNLFGQEIEATTNWPGVLLPREVWEKMGCPTVLMLTLDEVRVTA